MAKKKIDKEIESLDVPWSTESEQYKGTRVEQLIKKELRNSFGYQRVNVDVNDKVHLMSFRDKESYLLWASDPETYARLLLIDLELPALGGGGGTSTSVQRSLYIKNNMDGKSFASQKGEPCILDFTFVSKEKPVYSDDFEDTGERGECQVFVRNSLYGTYTLVNTSFIQSNVASQINVAEWLTAGNNVIMLKVKGETTEETTPAYTYNIQLTSLSVSAPNFEWWNVYSSDISIPFIIGGNVDKTLYVEITGDGYNMSYSKKLGITTYSDIALNYDVPFPGKEGVFHIKAYIENVDGSIRTKAVEYNIMCANEGSEIKLMCINNVTSSLSNWTDNAVFQYAIYDGTKMTTNADFVVTHNGEIIFSSENDTIPTSTATPFTYSLEIECEDDKFPIFITAKDGTQTLIEPVEFTVTNGEGYSSVPGAVLYINPKKRSNTQNNSQSIVNEVNNDTVPVQWTNFNWQSDGWVTDSDGNNVLKVFAGSKAVINYSPFSKECTRSGKTIEIDYMITNASVMDQNVISIGANNRGLFITPENIAVRSKNRVEPTTQDLPTDNGVRVRMSMVIMPDAYGVKNFNLVCIYINGRKNRQFTYQSNDEFANNGKIEIGNDNANVYLYSLRVYDVALSSESVEKNYRYSLSTISEKEADTEANDIMDAESVHIDFFATKAKYNVFTLDKRFPSLKNDKAVEGAVLEVFYADRPEENFSIEDTYVDGQGTSSKKYLEWNIRVRTDKLKDSSGNKIKSKITYADGTTEYSKVRMFRGVPKTNRMTFKKNWASSMQDHKMGCVNSFTDIWKKLTYKIGSNNYYLTNEGVQKNNEARISVYQEPFIGFWKEKNDEGGYTYTCMGEFTGGPDKGDTACFGYDTTSFPNLLAVEGSDNAPLGSLFRVPWNPQRSYWGYDGEEEAFQYNKANCWDYGAGNLDSDGIPAAVANWIDAYNTVYMCSNLIRRYDGTISQLNAESNKYNTTGYEYWTSDYNLWYYEPTEGKFIASDYGEGQINLKRQLVNGGYITLEEFNATSPENLNDLFINGRVKMARATFGRHFDIYDSCYQYVFTEFHGGTDNRAKNTYPYSFGDLWRWRGDDFDTIGPIDNQGQDRKPYWVEMHDSYDSGQPMWNGETSVFWNLFELAFKPEIETMAKAMMKAMEDLSGAENGTAYDRVYACYAKYFLQTKQYFPSRIVNADAKRYEDAKILYDSTGDDKYASDTDPITQSHGDFYSAETAWYKKRIMYMMSKYNYGVFSATGTDKISVRAGGKDVYSITYQITPALAMYPSVGNGTSVIGGPRTMEGETCNIEVVLAGSADQQNDIEGASWLRSIGDWHDKIVSGAMTVSGMRLQDLTLGSDDASSVVIAITSLQLGNVASLRKVVLTNIKTLNGSLDLSMCESLQEVYAKGTNLTQITLPNGGSLKKIVYPATNNYLKLQNFPVLPTSGIDISACKAYITDIFAADCPNVNVPKIIGDVINAQPKTGHPLARVYAVWKSEYVFNSDGAQILDNLTRLADGSYEGMLPDGLTGNGKAPILDGKIRVNANCYEDTVVSLNKAFPNLILKVIGEYYLRFIDKTAQDICVKKWGDNSGITKSQLASVNDIDTTFKGTSITNFEEGKYLNLTTFSATAFQGCTNLTNVHLKIADGSSIIFRNDAFYDCGNVDTIRITGNVSLLDGIAGDGNRTCHVNNLIIDGALNGMGAYGLRNFDVNNFYLNCMTPPNLNFGWGASPDKVTLYVPYQAYSDYKSTANYNRFKNIVAFNFDKWEVKSDLISISINGNGSYNTDFTLTIDPTPNEAKYKDVTWQITSGSEYASIDDSGNVTIVEGTKNQTIVVKATSTYDESITDTKTISVSNVPEDVIVLDSVTFDGASYIDTGYLPNLNSKVEIKFSVSALNVAIFGRRTKSGSDDTFALQCIAGGKIRAEFNGNEYSGNVLNVNQDYTVTMDKNQMVCDGQVTAYNKTSLGSSDLTCLLGSLNNGGTPHTNYIQGKIYYCKIYEDSVLKMYLVPVIKDGVIIFKDNVSGNYFENKGSGKLSE